MATFVNSNVTSLRNGIVPNFPSFQQWNGHSSVGLEAAWFTYWKLAKGCIRVPTASTVFRFILFIPIVRF